MSAGKQGKTTNWADDVIDTKIQDAINGLWGEMSGKVVSFNPQKQTATVQPLFKPKVNGKPVDMPQLQEVPVRFQRTASGMITFPIKEGDFVSLRPQMRSTENFHENGDGSASDSRAFSLSDMEAHVAGGESLSDPIQNFDSMNAHFRFDAAGNFGIKGSPDGKIQIQGAQGNVMDLLADVVELLASDGLNVKFGSSASNGGHELQHRAQYLAIAQKLRSMVM